MPASSFKANATPSVLAWARRTAGFDLVGVASRLHVDESRIKAWEGGQDSPTLVQLRHLSEIYRRPLSVFLLPEPPRDGQTIRDFRSLGLEVTPPLRFAIREAHQRRDVALELSDISAVQPPREFPTTTLEADPEVFGMSLREWLGVDLKLQSSQTGTHASLNYWRSAAESNGVLVFGFPRVDVVTARGFSISDQPFPVVALNNKDAPNGRVFTLVHECAHVALRSGDAVCDLRDGMNAEIEIFCNHVAGATLVPASALLSDPQVRKASRTSSWDSEGLSRLANLFRVSREVILRRLLTLGRTNNEHYLSWRGTFENEYKKYAARDAEGGKYSRTVVARLGKLYPRMVLDAHERDLITSSAASGYLGVKVNNFASIETRAHNGRCVIPDVCRHYGVQCLDIYGFVRAEGWSF